MYVCTYIYIYIYIYIYLYKMYIKKSIVKANFLLKLETLEINEKSLKI